MEGRLDTAAVGTLSLLKPFCGETSISAVSDVLSTIESHISYKERTHL